MGLGFRVSGLRLKALGVGLMGLGCRVYLGVVDSELSLLHRGLRNPVWEDQGTR